MDVFHVFLNCTNGAKARNAPHLSEIMQSLVTFFYVIVLTSDRKRFEMSNLLNLFQTTVTFLHPLKTSENQRFSAILRGYGNGALE